MIGKFQAEKKSPSSSGLALVGVLQRKCACGGTPGPSGECESCRKKKLQRRSEILNLSSISHRPSSVSEVPPIVHEVLRSPGQPLDAETRAFMEPRFGHNFSHVRVHISPQAADSVQAVNALAYTVGSHIAFGSGRYAPDIASGRKLLAHELTHVVQQNNAKGLFNEGLSIGPTDDAYEREADEFSQRVTVENTNQSPIYLSAARLRLQRKCKSPGGCSNGLWNYDYDGCSGPASWLVGIVDFDYDNPAGGKDTQFAKCLPCASGRACDCHDECYQTCHHGDESAKEKCDERMYADMVGTCFDAEDKKSKKCFKMAERYHRALGTHLSRNAYRKRQKQVCGCKQPDKVGFKMEDSRKDQPQGKGEKPE